MKAKRQRGGKSGRAKRKPFTDAILKVLAKDPKVAEKMVLELFGKGDARAFTLLRDTIEGKPAQPMTIRGDADKPLRVKTLHDIDARITELLQLAASRSPKS
jgi:hypothetical protein